MLSCREKCCNTGAYFVPYEGPSTAVGTNEACWVEGIGDALVPLLRPPDIPNDDATRERSLGQREFVVAQTEGLEQVPDVACWTAAPASGFPTWSGPEGDSRAPDLLDLVHPNMVGTKSPVRHHGGAVAWACSWAWRGRLSALLCALARSASWPMEMQIAGCG